MLPGLADIPMSTIMAKQEDSSGSRRPKNLLAKGEAGKTMKFLPEGFTPGPYDVICGRGRRCFNHIGNHRFRKIVARYINRYSQCVAKLEKTTILAEIVTHVRSLSPHGGFVKKDPESGRWYEVGDFLAREKTSQAFRDALHDQYRSSNAFKKKRRQEENNDYYYSSNESIELESALGSAALRVETLEETCGEPVLDVSQSTLLSETSACSVLDFGNRNSLLAAAAAQVARLNNSCPDLSTATALSFSSSSQQNFDWGSQQSQTDLAEDLNLVSGPGHFASRGSIFPMTSISELKLESPVKMSRPTLARDEMQLIQQTLDDDMMRPKTADSESRMLFENLMAFTDGCVSSGDPFEPVPMAEDSV